MNLLYLTDKYHPSVGGIEVAVRELARAAAAAGHRVRVAAVSDVPGNLGHAGYTWRAPRPHRWRDGEVEVTILGASPAQRGVMLPNLVRSVPVLGGRHHARLAELCLPTFIAAHGRTLERLAREAAIVHCFGAGYLGAAGLRAARRAGVPFVITPYCHPGHWGDDPLNLATYREADRVYFVGGDRPVYVTAGVDEARLGLMRQPVAPGPPVEVPLAQVPTALFLGRINRYKGAQLLVEAWPDVRRAVPGARLVLAGPLQEQVGRTEGVEMAGVVDGEAKARLVASSWLLALPSAGELLGAAVLEAWAHGVPVVVSDIDTFRELVRDGVDGLVVPRERSALAAALNSVLGSRRRRDDLSRGARGRATGDHSPAVVAAGLVADYEVLRRGVPVA